MRNRDTATSAMTRTSSRILFTALLALGAACAPRGEAGDIDAPPPVDSVEQSLPAGLSPSTGSAAADGVMDTGEGWTTEAVVKRAVTAPPVPVLERVRAAANQGFDRVVFEFESGRLPGYALEYVDRPVRRCGSGRAVEVAGTGWLEVRFDPANVHTEEGRPTVEERSLAPGLPALRQLTLTCDFEARVTWVLGVAAPGRYRVMELRDPTRLVVDVAHGAAW